MKEDESEMLKMAAPAQNTSESARTGNRVFHWICFLYRIIRYPVLAIAIKWQSVTLVV